MREKLNVRVSRVQSKLFFTCFLWLKGGRLWIKYKPLRRRVESIIKSAHIILFALLVTSICINRTKMVPLIKVPENIWHVTFWKRRLLEEILNFATVSIFCPFFTTPVLLWDDAGTLRVFKAHKRISSLHSHNLLPKNHFVELGRSIEPFTKGEQILKKKKYQATKMAAFLHLKFW